MSLEQIEQMVRAANPVPDVAILGGSVSHRGHLSQQEAATTETDEMLLLERAPDAPTPDHRGRPGPILQSLNGEQVGDVDERDAHTTSADDLAGERNPGRRWMLVAAATIAVLALGLLAVTAVQDPDSVQTDTVPPTPAPSTNPAVPSVFFHGEVTASAPDPWEVSPFFAAALTLNHQMGDQRVELVADPLPVATGCERGPAPADAEALARSIQSDPDLVATAPVDVRVGDVEGLVMDVTVAPGASVCEAIPSPQVVTQGDDAGYTGPRPPGLDLDQGSRMRLYLLDHPEGSATRILAIAIVAPAARFEDVIEAAAPIIESIEFHAEGR